MQLRPLLSLLGSPLRDRSRTLVALAALSTGLLPHSGSAGGGTAVSIAVTGLRSDKGVVRACMTRRADRFPNCRGDADSYKLVVPAQGAVTLDFGPVAPGRYAIALLHDENGNGKVDRALMMMPKEGYGFSRDAPVRMGPPRFDRAAFEVGETPVRQTIHMRYML